jgi:hypothetical protein
MAANWRSSSWVVDFKGIEELENKMSLIPGNTERIMNDVLHNEGVNIAIEHIKPIIPVSTWEGRVRNKLHAKSANPLTSKKDNLGFTIRPKPRFNYLKYPDLGIGRSAINDPRMFMESGLKRAAPKIVDRLSERLDQEIEKTLGGK